MASRPAVVVTGGLSGLGFATATRFAKTGYNVHIFDMRSAELVSLDHEAITYHQVDVRNDEMVATAFEEIKNSGDQLSGVVHCAGIASFGPKNPGQLVNADDLSVTNNLATIADVLRTNLQGTFSVVRHGAALMAANGRHPEGENGFIILTSSGAALEGKAGQSAYSASKAGIIGMTLPLAREFSALGIRVVTIAPGLFDTPILQDTPKLERHVPYPQRIGDPDEYARLALHIAENHYINADVIRIDGGIRGDFRSATPFIR